MGKQQGPKKPFHRHAGDKKPAAPKTLPKVRLMAPFTFQCDDCKEKIFKSTKFNARKRQSSETYLGIKIVCFTIRCPSCGSQIEFQTDPQTSGYLLKSGATLLNDSNRFGVAGNETAAEKLDRLEKEHQKQQLDPLSQLQASANANQLEAQRDEEITKLYQQAQNQQSKERSAQIQKLMFKPRNVKSQK